MKQEDTGKEGPCFRAHALRGDPDQSCRCGKEKRVNQNRQPDTEE
ncbi:MAG TPA: hypothetical protein VFP10_11615 [Candidatus Eisenbacteria bacterium]|nr:hypothetical protein [Candidatus Eisenbacteria bacterium]